MNTLTKNTSLTILCLFNCFHIELLFWPGMFILPVGENNTILSNIVQNVNLYYDTHNALSIVSNNVCSYGEVDILFRCWVF